jgi:hypothetical protein
MEGPPKNSKPMVFTQKQVRVLRALRQNGYSSLIAALGFAGAATFGDNSYIYIAALVALAIGVGELLWRRSLQRRWIRGVGSADSTS